MYKLENDNFIIEIENDVITKFYDKRDDEKINLAGNLNLFGKAGFTFVSDDITDPEERPLFKSYRERKSESKIKDVSKNSAAFYDEKNDISITVSLSDGLIIEAKTENKEISQFGVNLEFNFLGKLGTKFVNQIMPTSPYTSFDKKYNYCIMTRINGGFIVCAELNGCDGWKIDYSSECYGHYIESFSFLSSFDKVYGGSGRKNVKVYIKTAKTFSEAYEILHAVYNVPYISLVAGGNFGAQPVVKVSDDTDGVLIISPDGDETKLSVPENKVIKIKCNKNGFYRIVPYKDGAKGIDASVWYNSDMKNLFDLSASAIKKPYHGDDNLCEGG